MTGYGTGGTVSGVGRVLRRERPQPRVVLSEPVIGGGAIESTPGCLMAA